MREVSSLAGLLVCAGTVAGQYSTPNVVDTAGPVAVTLNGVTFVNHGLVGVGRMPAFLDAQGSTFGSVSSLAVTPGTFRYDAASGRFVGEFQTLPDRGRNDPASGSFVNYQGRVQHVAFSFTPLAAGDGSSQDQIRLEYIGLTLLAEGDGHPLVGNDPGSGAGTAFGRAVPRNAGNITLDAEGLVAMPDGSGWYVSDEYGSAIYRFDAEGVLTGVINPPQALMPRNAQGVLDFNSITAPAQGRRNNQGMEGVSLTPDGRYLIAVNQSGTMQDSGGSSQVNRRFTRVLVYDLSQGPTPEAPVGHYVLELPTLRDTGSGQSPNRTAASSEILALSGTQFLFLPRDSNGRGAGSGQSPVFKSVMLADLSGATNLVGTPYEGYTPVSPSGVLASGITTVRRVEAVNLLNLFDLRRFGLNLNINAQNPNGDINSLSEKWEGMALVPDTTTEDPTDYFLFVANDNDFLTQNGVMLTTDGQRVTYDDGFENDTVFLAYRVSLRRPACPADFTGDGFVDFFDYSAFVACFEGVDCPAGATADFNGDAFVDFFDYIDFVAAFEQGC